MLLNIVSHFSRTYQCAIKPESHIIWDKRVHLLATIPLKGSQNDPELEIAPLAGNLYRCPLFWVSLMNKNSIPARLVCVHSVTSLSSWYSWGNFWWLNLRMFFKLQLCEGLHISTGDNYSQFSSFWDEFGVSFHLVKQSAWATLLRSHEHVGWTKGEVTAVVQMHNLDRIEGMIGEGNFHKFNLLRIHYFPHRI